MRDYLRIRRGGALLAALLLMAGAARAQVPIDGYLPFVGFTLTDEFNDDFSFFPEPSFGVTGSHLGPSGEATYDLALLDTGAGFSLLTDQTFKKFALNLSSPGERDGYRGTETVTIGGATGELVAPINDPFGLYVSGLQDRAAGGSGFAMIDSVLPGQTNVSTITLPQESDLPNIIGLPFASQYATSIRNDSPQVFQVDGRTVRSPRIEFLPLGSGGGDIVRKAPMNLNPGSTFAQPPAYFPNIINFDIDKPQENPTLPTITQGGLFLNVRAKNNGGDLGGTREFFFDTGASVTVVSQLNALNLGFDVLVDEPDFTISVVGSGGILSDIPGFFADEFTIVALGGSITATNVPIIVLDVADPSDPGNVVEGIVGTNLLSGRNIVIDPNPSLGGGGPSAGVYISDPVTNLFKWTTQAPQQAWSTASSWDAQATPDLLSQTLLSPVSGGHQRALVSGDQEAWDMTVSGAGSATMTVRIADGASLTVFSGVTINPGGGIHLEGGVLDAQYVDIRGGVLSGQGTVTTGSGPIVGQIEALSGTIAPGDGVGALTIEGRLTTGDDAVYQFELAGLTPGAEHDQLIISDTLNLDGTLEVSLVDGGSGLFEPEVGNSFTLMTFTELGGQFDNLMLPSGYLWDVNYFSTSVVLEVTGLSLPGDFNGDGMVDVADYTVWRDGLGVTYNIGHYLEWRDAMMGGGGSGAFSVPEPASAGFLLCLLAACRLTSRPNRG